MVKFRKNKKEKVVEFKDEREPNIRFAILLMIRIVGWEMIWIIIGMLGYACFGAMPHIFNILMGELINIVVGADVTGISDKINNLAMWMAIIAAIAAILTWIGGSMMAYSFERIGVRLKNAYIESLMKQEIGYFDMKRTGELMSWMTESMEQIQDSFSNKLGRATQFLMQVILGIILSLVFSWKMALVMISFAPVIIFIMFASGLASQLITKRTLKISNEASAIANEVISAVRTVRSMDSENKEINRYKNKLWSGNVLYVIRAIILGAPIGAQEVSIWGVLALGMWWGGQLLVKSEIAFANMFRVFTLLLMSVLGSSQIMSVIPDLTRAIQSSKNLLKVIRRIPATRFDGGITPEKIIGEIEFKDVCFSYPTRPNIQVLKNFSLTIKPGQAIALVGSSGSGKSTIISLLERFYEPISGNIILDGNELTEIDPHWLRTHVGLVGQEPVLFSGSIKENICYAIRKSATDPFPSDEEIINAAKAANAHDFISALPDGYNTVLGERGVSLSGGQKQRIAIARSVIQNPEILLLDEATSALDTNSEAVVQDALNRLMKGRTTIVIAHRLSTIVNSDLICVFHKGELKEQGTHDQLMNTGGLYSELAKKQMMRKQDSSEELAKIVSEEEIGIDTPYKSQATFETVVSKESLSSTSDE